MYITVHLFVRTVSGDSQGINRNDCELEHTKDFKTLSHTYITAFRNGGFQAISFAHLTKLKIQFWQFLT